MPCRAAGFSQRPPSTHAEVSSPPPSPSSKARTQVHIKIIGQCHTHLLLKRKAESGNPCCGFHSNCSPTQPVTATVSFHSALEDFGKDGGVEVQSQGGEESPLFHGLEFSLPHAALTHTAL